MFNKKASNLAAGVCRIPVILPIFIFLLVAAKIVVSLDDSIISPIDLEEQEEHENLQLTCREGTFVCKYSKKCIPKGWICDGFPDCGIIAGSLIQDMSDEEGPSCASDHTCPPNEYKCSDGTTCIRVVDLCNGDPQCPNKEDEHKYCNNSTICSEAAEKLHCKYGCKPSSTGEAVCYCALGQEHNGKECMESNECMKEGACDQICELDENKKKMCSCQSGYTSDGSKCLAKDIPSGPKGKPLILYQDSSDLKWIFLNGSQALSHPSLNSPPHSGIIGLDYDHLNDTVCWITHSIQSHSMKCGVSDNLRNSWNKPKPYMLAFEDVYQLSFDWISTNFYFVDEGLELIFVCKENLDLCKVVIDANIAKPRGLALDPLEGFMFITVWGKSGAKLERANLDGTDRKSVISKKIVYPHGIALDLPKKTIYWVDKFLDSIERADYDGLNRRTVHRGIPHLQDISVFQNDLYFISMQDNSINKLNKYESGNYSTLIRNLTKPFAIKIFHRVKQQSVNHPCGTHQGQNKCQDFCFALWKNGIPKAQCGCREGYALRDGNCNEENSEPSFMIYTKANLGIIRSVSLRNGEVQNSSNGVMIPIIRKGSYSGLALDYKNRTLYYSDTTNFRIMYKEMYEIDSKVYLSKDIGHIGSIAVDWIGRNLYWIDETLPAAIYVSRITDSSVKKLLVYQNLTSPRALIVSPTTGMMYWANSAEIGKNDGSIEQSWMDGSHREYVVQGLGWPTVVAMDHENKYIYWIDSLKSNVQRKQIANPSSKTETIWTANFPMHGEATDFSYYNGSLYIAIQGRLHRVEVPSEASDNTKPSKLTTSIEGISEFHMFDSSLQRGKGKCTSQNCKDLCLSNPGKPGYQCACRDGFSFNKDGKTCIVNPNYKFPLEYQSNRHLLHTEVTETLNNGTINCSEFEFQCITSKRCVPKSWVCDGERDCGKNDDSDEHDLCVYPECTRLQFKCTNSSRCIPLELVCDGIKDCPGDGADEYPAADCNSHCSRNRTDAFYCELDNKCINKSQQCDGQCHCSDAADEINCGDIPKPECAKVAVLATHDFECDFDVGYSLSLFTKEDCYNVSCGRHSFHCASGSQCLPLKARCDGNVDCKHDSSDEENCPFTPVACNFPSRLCDKGTKCVTIQQMCNSKFDCLDKTDEGHFCSKKSCNTANCSHNCTVVPEGHLCYCPINKHVDPMDKSQCIDEHPCDKFGTCSQLCSRYGNKNYHCLCQQGYSLREDGITCSSVVNERPYLVFSNRHELRGLYLNSTSVFQPLISNLRNSIALDFYYQGDGKYDIFWSDVVDDKIYRGALVSGSLINIQIVIEKGLATAEGLAVDWIGGNIYWVESNLDQIEVAKLNGSFRETLISGDMVSPRSIAVDPNVGLLFWSDWQTEAPRIERASMSGKYRTKVFNVGSSGEGAWPNGLTLDYVLGRIYWVDARLDSIHTVKYDGSDYQTVLHDHEALSHPFSITLFESILIWTDWRSNSVMKANKFHGGNVTTIHKTYTQPFDVKVLHQTRQPRKIKNPCDDNNGDCSHLCLLSVNRTHDCGCPHLMSLSADNKTCIKNEKMLLFSRLNEIRAVYFDKPYYHAAPPISYPLIIMPANLHFVARDKQVYWSDSQSGETKRANISNPIVDTLIDASAGKPLAIGVDWISNLIFIAVQTSSGNSISVTNLDGQFFSTIIQGKQDLKNVNSIAVNPYKAQIFWPDGLTSNDFKINSANMDGSKRKVLCNSRETPSLENPASLSYDFTSERLYWVNLNTELIHYYDFTTTTLKHLNFGDLKPHVITVYGSSIFFATEKQDAIMKADKTNGGAFEYVRNYTENIYSIRVYDPEEQNGMNDCGQNTGGCQQLCIPLLAKHICKCAQGYIVDENDSSKCRTQNPVLVYSDSHGIKGISTLPNHTEDLLVPIPLVSFATDIDVVEGSDHLYWLDSEKGKISSIKRDGTEKETILKDLTAVSGLCIDWIAKNLYWANPKDSYIEVSHLNGSSHYVLITENLEKPLSLAIDPARGYLFWSDVVKGNIERATLDGRNRNVIVSEEKASDITLDMENQRLYWCHSTNDKIESVTYDGLDRLVVYSGAPDTSHLHSPIVSKGYLYWVDIGDTGGAIMSLPVKNFSRVQTVRKDLGVTIKDLTIFSRDRQVGSNPCGTKNGGCEDLCFWNGTYANCICAHGKLGSNGKSCEPFDAFIAYSRVSSIETVHLSPEITPNDPYPAIQSSEHIRNAIGLAFDYKNNLLFYSDVQLGTINSVYFNGTEFSVVADKQGSVEGLYFEASHSDLYWTCSNDASINRINPHLSSSKVEKLIKLSANDKPRGIGIDPCESRVYWTNWDSSRPSIQRAYLSGYRIESIITTDIRMPNSLALDHPTRKLYWVDARLDKIEKCNLDGSNRVVVARNNPKHAFSLAIYGDYVVWTDWVRLSVMRANKYTGENVEQLRKEIPKPMALIAVAPQDIVCESNPVLNGACSEGKSMQPDGQCAIKPTFKDKSGNCEDWTCDNGNCVTEKELCNGVDDCFDNSDEIGCGINECEVQPNPCAHHRCINKPIGYECVCSQGFEHPSSNNKTFCQIRDNCKARPCSQLCHSSLGSYKCSCESGYIDEDGVCKANTNFPIKIMFTNQYYIRLVNDTTSNNGSLISQNLTNAVALDFHWDFGCIYWSDVTALGSSIKRTCSKTNKSEDIGNNVEMTEQVLHHSISSPDGIAVDWVALNLYWCDKGTNTIEVSKLDGRFRKVLVEGLQDPRAIVLDPFRGSLYWSDWGEEPIIGKSGMDGTMVQTLISEKLGWPNALTISYETQEIWWADAKEDYISVADLNGKNIRTVHSRTINPGANIHHTFSLTTFEDWIYWSDWETKTIERCHKYTGKNQTSITPKLIHRPMDVKVFHPFRQRPLKNNPCKNNGNCQNLCLLSPKGKVCACPENFILNPDNLTCKSNCSSSHFVCENSSKCIPRWWKCDTQEDCENGEDEPSSCPPFNCNPGQVQFDNNTCLYPTSICNGINDTIDGKDELDCDNYTCLSSHFKCQGNGTIPSKCIASQHKCDGNKDCYFGDDEELCTPTKCPPTQFQCATNGKCLQMEWICDKELDCENGSDEENCENRVCPDQDKYRCKSGKCIPRTWTCDGERDCFDGEDEAMDECEQPITCEKNPSYYLCKHSHKCIPSRWKCDYEVDCPESDDELEDCVPRNCSESEVKCGDGRCIHTRFLCDNTYECSDGSDETDCPVTCNTLTEFQCITPHTCLPRKFVCDGEFDCLDGSDEQSCGNSTYCDGFRCEKNNECIPYAWLCDGSFDCFDGEDEQMCNKTSLTSAPRPTHCSENEFQCSDENCISQDNVCDRIIHCQNDEIGCPECKFGECSQQCVKKKLANRGKATQMFCECVEGYYLEGQNKTRCSAKGKHATLVIASEDHLLRLNRPHDVDNVDLLISTTPTKIESVDFIMEKDGSVRLFWSSRTSKAIQMMYVTSEGNNINSRHRRASSINPTDIIPNLEDPRGVSINWVSKIIYFVDAGHKTISASSLDGKSRMVIISRLSEPFDIAVDPGSGRIFWSDLVEQKIEYAMEDGSRRTVIVHSPRPAGIAIDHPAERLYFSDLIKYTIESTTLEGKDRQVIKPVSLDGLKPFKLDVFEDTVYFTNHSSNKILRLNKFGKGNVSDITYGAVKASDIVLIQEQKQIPYKNICAMIPCLTPGLCLRNGSQSAACYCPNFRNSSRNYFGTTLLTECSIVVPGTICDLKCKADGKCMIDGNGQKFCKCQKGYSGLTCEKTSEPWNPEIIPNSTPAVDLCTSRVCRNNGKCEVIEQIAYCRCSPSFVGVDCQVEAGFNKPCQNWCLHKGLCLKLNLEQPNECKCSQGYYGIRCERKNVQDSQDTQGKVFAGEEDSGLTWILVLVFILVALSVASISGCVAYFVMRRKGRPFMHRRMQDSGTVEISNPMFLKDEGDEDHSEPSLIFDSDKVLLQGTNFANPVYETMYKEGETSTSNDEKKGLLSSHPLADPLA